jgi:AMMECR1 domain-containing protein
MVVGSLVEVGNVLPNVARAALRAFVRGASPEYVTLRLPDGGLRGCVGSTEATTSTVTEETVRSAIMAASRDPRFPELTAEELPALRIEVSVLLPPEAVVSLAELAPQRYGVIVREQQGSRQGLLLPGIEGIDDAATQVAIARRKAGLMPTAAIVLRRFEVLKYSDERAFEPKVH